MGLHVEEARLQERSLAHAKDDVMNERRLGRKRERAKRSSIQGRMLCGCLDWLLGLAVLVQALVESAHGWLGARQGIEKRDYRLDINLREEKDGSEVVQCLSDQQD